MIEVRVTSVIPAEVGRVWSVIRDFNGMPAWHPLIDDSRIETGAPSDQIGCVRQLTLSDGAVVRERLLSLSDFDRSFAYEIVEADIPLLNYAAGVALDRVTDGEITFGRWWAKFDAPPGKEDELSRLVADEVFQAGFDALKARFE